MTIFSNQSSDTEYLADQTTQDISIVSLEMDMTTAQTDIVNLELTKQDKLQSAVLGEDMLAGTLVKLYDDTGVPTITPAIISDPSKFEEVFTDPGFYQGASSVQKAAAIDPATNRFAIIDAHYGPIYCRPGQINSNGTVTWGTPVLMYTSSSLMSHDMHMCWDEEAGKFHCFFEDNWSSHQARLISFSIDSNLDCTLGSVRYRNNNPSEIFRHGTIHFIGSDSTGTSKVLFLNTISSTTQGPRCQVGVYTHATDSWTWGSVYNATYVAGGWSGHPDFIYDSTSDKGIMTYHDQFSSPYTGAHLMFINISGTVLTFTGAQQIYPGSGVYPPYCSLKYDPDADKYLLIIAKGNTSTILGYACDVNFNTSTFTKGPLNTIASNQANGQEELGVEYNRLTKKFVISNPYIGNNDLVASTVYYNSSDNKYYPGTQAVLPGSGYPIKHALWYTPTTGTVLTFSSSDYGFYLTDEAIITANDFMGVLQESGNTGETKFFAPNGSISTIHSDLIAGDTYYGQSDGSLDTTSTDIQACIAIDSTSIFVFIHLRPSGFIDYNDVVNMSTGLAERDSVVSTGPDGRLHKSFFGRYLDNVDDDIEILDGDIISLLPTVPRNHTMPNNPDIGARFIVICGGNVSTNNVVLTNVGDLIQDSTADFTCSVDFSIIEFFYTGVTHGWSVRFVQSYEQYLIDQTTQDVAISDLQIEPLVVEDNYLAGPIMTSSATYVDMTGSDMTITLDRTTKIAVFMTFEAHTSGAGTDAVGEFALDIDGTVSQGHSRFFSGTNDLGIGAVTFASPAPLVAGTYTIKGLFRRVSGTKDIEIDTVNIVTISR